MKKSFMRAERRRMDGGGAKHDLGQHFLNDDALLAELVAATGVGKSDCVLEIGAGQGALTKHLCAAAGKVTAVEVDADVLPMLRFTTRECDNLTIAEGDIRKLDLRELCAPLGEGFYVIANIPYNITTPIFDLLWESRLPIKQISVMVQKEVAQKLMAAPSTEHYGILSVRCRYLCEPSLVKIVPADAFTPPPKVDSAFVRLDMRAEPPEPVADEALMLRLVRAGFNLRRKTLSNALKGVTEQARLIAAMEQSGVSPSARGEALDVTDWIRLSNAYHRLGRRASE